MITPTINGQNPTPIIEIITRIIIKAGTMFMILITEIKRISNFRKYPHINPIIKPNNIWMVERTIAKMKVHFVPTHISVQ
jgi:hypothetical protein